MLPKLLFVLILFLGLFVGFRVVQYIQFQNAVIDGYRNVSPPTFSPAVVEASGSLSK